MRGLISRMRSLWHALRRRSENDVEMEEEFRFHVERRAADLATAGLSPAEAMRRARIEFGSVERYKAEGRESRGLRWADELSSNLRYAARSLRKRPAFTVAGVLTLAIGVGGTSAVYALARGLLLDPLPFAHEREVGVFWKKTDWTHEEFLYLRGRTPGFRAVALYRTRDFILREQGEPARLLATVLASAELFDVLGATPLFGRGFRTGDDEPGAEPAVVLSHGLWQELGGDASVVGTRLTLDGTPRTVVGVMPRGFWFPDPSIRVWMAEPLDPESRNWNSTLVGRVGPNQDVHAMAAPLARLTAMLDERFDYAAQWDKTHDARITPVRDDLMGAMRPALLATLGAMGLILLIACANVAALMLGHVEARSVELAVCTALGANRRQLIQQLVVEAMLIAAAAGVLGAALAWGGSGVLAGALQLDTWTEATGPDWTLFTSAMGIAMTAALLVVLVPIASLWRGNVRGTLGSARTGTFEGRGGRLENGLVVAEVGFAMLIAAGAALLVRSVGNVYAVEPGVRIAGVGVVDIMASGLGQSRPWEIVDGLTEAFNGMPGVRSAAIAQQLPLRGGGYRLPMSIEGRPDLEDVATEYRLVTPGYLEAIGIALLRGRTIGQEDRADKERVVVINEAFARTYFPGIDPIGRRVGGDIGSFARVIGVVADAAETQLTADPVPVRYVPVAQTWFDEAWSLVFHAPGVDPVALLDAARQTVQRVAPAVAIRNATTMSRVLDNAVGPGRQLMSLLSLLAGLALTLGAVGIYGVIAHFAARRRREWAIRMALGLRGYVAVGRVVGHATLLVMAGVGLGAVAAAGLSRLLASFLYDVSTIDTIAFVAAGAVLLAVGLLAAIVPALRTGMTNPAIVLREQ